MMKVAIAVISVLIIGALGFFIFGQRQDSSQGAQKTQEEVSETANKQDADVDVDPAGGVIAGSVTPYKEFTKADYDRAIADGKVVFLNFYANWCPVCRAEAPDLVDGFNKLNNPNVVGFRVNFKDDETDEAEKALASEFGITYQHSKVIVKDGQTVYKQIAEDWDSNKVVSELGSL